MQHCRLIGCCVGVLHHSGEAPLFPSVFRSFWFSDAPEETLPACGWRALPGCSHWERSRIQTEEQGSVHKIGVKPFILILLSSPWYLAPNSTCWLSLRIPCLLVTKTETAFCQSEDSGPASRNFMPSLCFRSFTPFPRLPVTTNSWAFRASVIQSRYLKIHFLFFF